MKYWLLLIEDSSGYALNFFIKEKSGLAESLIKSLKTKYNLQVQYLHCNNAQKNVAFEKPVNRKGWECTLNILPQVCHNKMAMSNANLLPFSTRYEACSMVVNSMIFYIMANGMKLQTLPHFSKTIS